MGSIMVWHEAQAGFLRCSSRRSRTGRGFEATRVFFERRNIGRRRGRRGAEYVLHDLLAAHHGRCAVGERSDRENAALAEQPEAIGIGQRDAPETVAFDIGNAVMARQKLIHEGVVGRSRSRTLRSSRTMLSKNNSVSRRMDCNRLSSKSG